MEVDVIPTSVQELAQGLSAIAQGLESDLGTLDAAAARLIAAWEGEAREAFTASFRLYRHRMDAQLDVLRQAAAAAAHFAGEYSAADQKGSGAIPH